MEASKTEQRAVIRFLVAEGDTSANICRRMKAVYGEHCVGRAQQSIIGVRNYQASCHNKLSFCTTMLLLTRPSDETGQPGLGSSGHMGHVFVRVTPGLGLTADPE